MVTVLNEPFHVRSTSIPSRPQPIALEIEEELKKLRTCVASTCSTTPQAICNALREMDNVYERIEIILQLPSNQQELSRNHQKKWVDEELEQSIKVLDLCTVMRENLVAIKEHAEDLGLALQRKDAMLESKIQAYTRSQKKAQKEIKNCFRNLKQTYNAVKYFSTSDKYCDASMTIRLLIEAREIIISLLLSIFSFLSKSKSELKDSKWSFMSKALRRRKVACENELEYRHDTESFEDLENGLDCLFKRLILNRVSLLNTISLWVFCGAKNPHH